MIIQQQRKRLSSGQFCHSMWLNLSFGCNPSRQHGCICSHCGNFDVQLIFNPNTQGERVDHGASGLSGGRFCSLGRNHGPTFLGCVNDRACAFLLSRFSAVRTDVLCFSSEELIRHSVAFWDWRYESSKRNPESGRRFDRQWKDQIHSNRYTW